MAKTVVITGLKQVDTALAKLEPKLQNKFTKEALKNCSKLVVAAAKSIIEREAYNTGTLAKSFTVRSLKRKRGRVGVSMFVVREKLFADYAAAYGHPPHPMKDKKGPHYYLASIEFGFELPNGAKVAAVKPMRRAIYENQEEVQKFFIRDVQSMIAGYVEQ